jgi:Flp pilus assembly protein TadB
VNRLQVAAVAGLLVVAGLALGWRALRRTPTPLAQLQSKVFRSTPTIVVAGPSARPTRWAGLAERLARSTLGLKLGSQLGTDLQLIDSSMPKVMADLAAGVVIAFMVAVLSITLLIALGVASPGPVWVFVPVLFALGGFAMVWGGVRSRTQTARRDLRQAVTDFVQLVAVCLTTNRSIEEAATFAARAGQGKGFDIILAALETAPQMGVTVWEALDTVGRTYKVPELRDLSSSVERQAQIGVGVVETVTQMATSMRARALDELQRAADQTDSNLVLPTTMFVFGMILFLAYPLATRIGQSFGG